MNKPAAAADSGRASPKNPFLRVPEVKLGRDQGGVVQVPTEAVAEVRKLVVEFLTAQGESESGHTADPTHTGRAVAILGDYGVGKSHLAAEFITELGRADEASPVVLIADARPGDTVLSLYQRLVGPPGSGSTSRIQPLDTTGGVLLFGMVEQWVAEVYARLSGRRTAEHGTPPPATSDELTVEEVWALQESLTELVGDEELASVLRLVWHKTVHAAAWKWLCGQPLGDDERQWLADRGVAAPPIADDMRAMTALNALARLCGQVNGRMVLIIDELHLIRPGGGDGWTEATTILRDFIDWAGRTGSLLTVCGLLDFWRALKEGLGGRTVTEIRPAGLTVEQIKEYIGLALGADDRPDDALYPFTSEAVDELWKITKGHPRRTIAICHHAYAASLGLQPIGPRQIQRASRELTGPDTPDDAKAKIADWCAEAGFHVERARHLEPVRPEPDLVITSRLGGGECGIVVSGSVVGEEELDRLLVRAVAVAGGGRPRPPRAVILVVVGLLAAGYEDRVKDAFAHVLSWRQQSIRDELTTTLRSYVSLDDQRGLYELVLELQSEMREIKTGLATTLPPDADEAAARGSEHQWADPDRRRRHDEALQLCERALEAVQPAPDGARAFWQRRFQFGQTGLVDRRYAPGRREVSLTDMTSPQIHRALGAMVLLEDVVRQFSVRIQELLRDESRSMDGIRGELAYLSRVLDDSLSAVTNSFPRGADDPGDTIRRFMGVDRDLLTRQLGRLGTTVYSAIYEPRAKDGGR
jgi:hypothetical protein